MRGALHQMPAKPGPKGAGGAGRADGASGEAVRAAVSDEAPCPRHQPESTGQGLLVQVLAADNMRRAWKRVKANRGAAGVDGLDIASTGARLKNEWPGIRARLLAGTYRPQAVRRVCIPKPDGGQRELGIPTVVDRLIQQALLQVLQPLIDPRLSEHSHGFRPGRRAHDAVLAARRHVQDGYRVVVDVDLEKFFDRVNHDILMSRLQRHVAEPAVLRLIRGYLDAGIMDQGVVQERTQGTPQGGPLSPLLANVLLDDVDRELERRGLRFERYADDCNIYVRSQKAGRRVLAGLRQLYGALELRINEAKSAVVSAYGRKFLGYELWASKRGDVMLGVADRAIRGFKARVRQITRRSRGQSLVEVIERLRAYLPGWKAYFGLAQTPRVWRGLDAWVRHRLRALQLKQWRRGPTIYREARKIGASPELARLAASAAGRWWRGSMNVLNSVLTIAHFDRLGVPRLC